MFPHRVRFFKVMHVVHNRAAYPIMTVQPVPAPVSTRAELNNSKRLTGNSQKLILFKRGNAISGAPINIGTIRFPNPPIRAGITMKKIINNACAVITSRGQYVCNLWRPQTLPSEPYVIVSHHTARHRRLTF